MRRAMLRGEILFLRNLRAQTGGGEKGRHLHAISPNGLVLGRAGILRQSDGPVVMTPGAPKKVAMFFNIPILSTGSGRTTGG